MPPQSRRISGHRLGASSRSVFFLLDVIYSLSKYTGMNPIDGDRLRGHVETMVLAVLECSEGHGLAIIKRLEEAGCGALRMKEGSLYPALYRMEKAGLVTARWEESAPGRRGPRRRIYRINRKGKKHLQRGRDQWQQFVAVVGGIVVGAPA